MDTSPLASDIAVLGVRRPGSFGVPSTVVEKETCTLAAAASPSVTLNVAVAHVWVAEDVVVKRVVLVTSLATSTYGESGGVLVDGAGEAGLGTVGEVVVAGLTGAREFVCVVWLHASNQKTTTDPAIKIRLRIELSSHSKELSPSFAIAFGGIVEKL